jgi:hypothetical protein
VARRNGRATHAASARALNTSPGPRARLRTGGAAADGELRGPGLDLTLAGHPGVLAPVAQLDRASVYGTEGREFESLRARWEALRVSVRTPRSIGSAHGPLGLLELRPVFGRAPSPALGRSSHRESLDCESRLAARERERRYLIIDITNPVDSMERPFLYAASCEEPNGWTGSAARSSPGLVAGRIKRNAPAAAAPPMRFAAR